MKKILLFLTLLLSSTLVAQETPTLTPTVNDKLTVSADLVFPQQLFFDLTVALPVEQVSLIVLTLTYPNSDPIVMRFPQDVAYTFAKEYIVANAVYRLTSDKLPPLFSTITYQWQVVTTTNDSLLASGALVYQDERTTWETSGSQDKTLVFTTAQDQRLNGDGIVQQLTPLMTRLQSDTGFKPRLKLLIYPPTLPIGCDLNADAQPIVTYTRNYQTQSEPCDVALAQRAFTNSGYTVVQVTDESAFITQLRTNFITDAYQALWGGVNVPSWFASGLEQVYLTPSSDLLILRQRLRNSRPFTSAQLQTVPSDAATLPAWRSQAYSLIVYLMDTYGVPSVFALARDLGKASAFSEAYQQAFGQSLDLLLPSWQTWLYTLEADEAYTYSIYAGITPTPTATLTPTNTKIPPTPTYTPTITPDTSPTPRPSRTPIPPTATITPLAGQSFTLRVTATPGAPVSATARVAGLTTSQLTIVGIGAILTILIVISGFFWSRRQ